MEIAHTKDFLNYYERLRERTLKVVACIPPDRIEWRPAESKWTLGDIVRHIAAIERRMYGETLQSKPTQYRGCGTDLAEGHEATLAYFNRMHEESMAIFSAITDAQLIDKCTTPAGHPITTWKWLRALCEHEIHHRGQLYTCLGILGIKTPPLYGLTSEEVAGMAGVAD